VNERKHLAENTMDIIDVCRQAREAVSKCPADVASSLGLIIEQQTTIAQRHLIDVWDTLYRIKNLANEIAAHSSAPLTGETK
jgi:hypothetical protein